MENRNILKHLDIYIAGAAILLLCILLRLLPHPPNIAPIGALALFGGVYFEKRLAFILPLIVMIISDLFLGFDGATPFVYASFLITVMIGVWIQYHKNLKNIIIGSLLSSVLFYFITNFGVWATSEMYSKDFSGLMQSYLMGIPFFRNTIVGDLMFTGIFFYGYELVRYVVKNATIAIIKIRSINN